MERQDLIMSEEKIEKTTQAENKLGKDVHDLIQHAKNEEEIPEERIRSIVEAVLKLDLKK